MSMSRLSTWTQWMHSHPVARSKTPSRKRYSTGEQPRGVTAMPRARSASANGPVPSRTSIVSARDSARCTASGSASRPARSATARYSGSLTVYGALRRAGGRVGGRGVLQRAERGDPGGEVALRVLVGEVRQLEVCVCVDEAGDEAGVRKRELTGPRRRGDEGMGADGGDGATVVNENGAVLDGRRGNRMHGPGMDAEHEGSGLGVRGSGAAGALPSPSPRAPSP